jgi:hypothetical protein
LLVAVDPARPGLITVPSTDTAFRRQVDSVWARSAIRSPEDLERRLRRLFPRVLVRERALWGEAPAWYVYRDGRWLPPEPTDWWTEPDLPRVVVSMDGWIQELNQPARGILGIPLDSSDPRHFTDFVAPGTLEDSQRLFAIIAAGDELTATVLLNPTGGEVIGCDIHAFRKGDRLVGVLRLAEDIEPIGAPTPPPTDIATHPASDIAFRRYTEMLLSRMPEPTAEGLAIRLHRIYPHARVEPAEGRWVVFRDASGVLGPADGWWLDTSLPRVTYDPEALIVDANESAKRFFGSALVGHHWQEFTTPGSTDRVGDVLLIIIEAGVAISRFRMPSRDGSLVEFDSFTEYDGAHLTTIMRPIDQPADEPEAPSGEAAATPAGATAPRAPTRPRMLAMP